MTSFVLIMEGTSLKTNMTGREIPIFNEKYIFIHGGFSIAMLVFGRGYPNFEPVFHVPTLSNPKFQGDMDHHPSHRRQNGVQVGSIC